MLNDYYAASLSDIRNESSRHYILSVIKSYSSAYVSKLHLSIEYSPEITVASHLVKYNAAIKALVSSAPKSVDLTVVHTIPLVSHISEIPDLEKLAITNGNKKYLHIRLPFGMTPESVIEEIHHLLYKRHLVPIILSVESIGYYLDKKLVESIMYIPGAIYQINLSNIHRKETKEILNNLIKQNKTVIFGSADKFDAFLLANPDYYLKHIKEAVGEKKFTAFALNYNKLFC